MERLKELVEKELLTLEEMEKIEEMDVVTNVEDNGMSGNHIGYHWYTVVTEDGEYDVYVK